MQIDFVEGSALWSNQADTQERDVIKHYSSFLSEAESFLHFAP